MTYKEYKKARQDEFNNLPIFFAFGNEQFKKAMEERGLTENDVDKVYRFGDTGGFYLKKDADIIRNFMNKPDKLNEYMKNPEFAESAFYYEMGNHEYHINWQGDWDVCSCFGDCEYSDGKTYVDYLKEIGYTQETINAFKLAKKRFHSDCIKNDWY